MSNTEQGYYVVKRDDATAREEANRWYTAWLKTTNPDERPPLARQIASIALSLAWYRESNNWRKIWEEVFSGEDYILTKIDESFWDEMAVREERRKMKMIKV